MVPNMASDHWLVASDHEVILPDTTPYTVVSRGIPIPISPHLNGGRLDLVVHLVMSNNGLELARPSTRPVASSIVVDGTLQEESGGNNRQLQGQPTSSTAGPHSLATSFPNRSQYTPPYTPGRSHADSTTSPLGEVAPVGSDVEILCTQVQASKASAHDAGTGSPQNLAPPGQTDAPRTETSPSVHGSRSRTHSPTHGHSPVIETQHREVEYTSHRHNGNHPPSYSPHRYPVRGLSTDPDQRAASGRGRSPSPKSLVDDHEQIEDLDHDVSITLTNHARSLSSSSISGIESRRESLSRSQSRDVISSHVHHRRGYTPPRMNTQRQPQWTRPASPIHTADASYHEANETPPVTRAEGRGSLASRLDITWTPKKAPTPTMPHPQAEVPITRSPPTYRFGKMRSEDYGADGRQTRRRLQDRIDGNQTGTFGSKFNHRCPYSHRVNGANDCHDKNQPHPGYTSDEWRNIMEYVQRFGHAPPQLTKEGCVYHPSFKPPEGFKPPENFKPAESSQPRSHPLNPFNMPPTAQGTDRYIPPPTPPVPQQTSMAIPYPHPAPMPVPMPTPQFSPGPPPHSYPQRPAHMGASHTNPFDTGGTFGARPPLKKRRTGPKGQFRTISGDYGSQQTQSYQWPPQSMPPPNWGQQPQPPSNYPSVSGGRPNHIRQAHRPNIFHNQQGQPPVPPPNRRKRNFDQV